MDFCKCACEHCVNRKNECCQQEVAMAERLMVLAPHLNSVVLDETEKEVLNAKLREYVDAMKGLVQSK